MAVAQYLYKYSFEKYEDGAIFAASKFGFPVITSMTPESVAAIIYFSNITLTTFRIICNYIKRCIGETYYFT